MMHLEYYNLVDKLNKACAAYYAGHDLLMTDEMYDAAYFLLQDIEKKHPDWIVPYSPTQRIGADPVKKFPIFIHQKKMGSLENTFDLENAQEWFQDWSSVLNSQPDCIIEPKIDGLAINLVYEFGVLTNAATRGNGDQGELITANAKTIKNIPLKIDDQQPYLEIRGEVFLTIAQFHEVNENQRALELKEFVNPRNAAAGSLRQFDSSITASRKLSFIAYTVAEHPEISSQSEALDWLASKGFRIAQNIFKASFFSEVVQAYEWYQKHRATLPYEIDGVVIKVNEYSAQQEIGEYQRSPRWAVAWKFPATKAITKLINIEIQVGRLGAITPVAHLEPVAVGGVIVQYASLHNFDDLSKKNIKIGDMLIIQRAGDVIPDVIENIPDQRDGSEIDWELPLNCPSCSAVLQKKETVLICPNTFGCIEQRIQQIAHFASSDAIDIDGLSIQTVRKLWNQNMIKGPADLYLLSVEDILKLEGFAEKSAYKLIEMIQKKKSCSAAKFLWSLGFRHIGLVTAKKIFDVLTWGDFLKATEDDFLTIDSIGPIIANSLVETKNHPYIQAQLKSLEDLGFFIFDEKKNHLSTQLKGLKFVITGSFDKYSRAELSALIESHGGALSSSVTSKTNYVICGEDSGNKKNMAQEKNIPILSIDDFLKMI